MRLELILILTGRRMSRQSRELLQSTTDLEKQEEQQQDERCNNNNEKSSNALNQNDDAGAATQLLLSDAASTTASHSGVSVLSDNLSCYGCDPPSSALKVKTCQESIQQTYSSRSLGNTENHSTDKPKVRFSRVAVHYHSMDTYSDDGSSNYSKSPLSASNIPNMNGRRPHPSISLGWKRLESQYFEDIDRYEMVRPPLVMFRKKKRIKKEQKAPKRDSKVVDFFNSPPALAGGEQEGFSDSAPLPQGSPNTLPVDCTAQ